MVEISAVHISYESDEVMTVLGEWPGVIAVAGGITGPHGEPFCYFLFESYP